VTSSSKKNDFDKYNIFLSHKAEFANKAKSLADVLHEVVPGAAIFRSEEIAPGSNWKQAINRALRHAKCCILLYTGDQNLDWSWCLFEVGAFMCVGSQRRAVFCLHPQNVSPPSQLADLQTIVADRESVENWIQKGLCDLLKCEPAENELKVRAKQIVELVNELGPVREHVLKPYIWIEPKWSGNWTAPEQIPDIDFSDASVLIDGYSATQLGFAGPPDLKLLQFLRRMSCDISHGAGKLEFWIKKFFEALRRAVCGDLDFREVAYFRHQNGKIYRPVVVSYAKNASGTKCKLRVIFGLAFGTPLTDSPGLVQRLSIGARLAVRTRLEILDPFLGRVAQVQAELNGAQDDTFHVNPVGSRLVEALDTIWQEALSYGLTEGQPAPILFEGAAQQSYETLRAQGHAAWNGLKDVAPRDDDKGDYTETERLLSEVKLFNDAYLALVLPRIQQLLVPPHQKDENRAS
jgi:TIR domain